MPDHRGQTDTAANSQLRAYDRVSGTHTLARTELRERLGPLVARARRRWLHPTSSHRPGERFL